MLRDEKIGFLLVNIPRSDSFLHRSRRDREFYRRHGHGFFKMEHYDIAEFYGRRKNPALKVWWGVRFESSTDVTPNRVLRIPILVGIENIGRGIAKHPAILIRGNRCSDYGLDGNRGTGLPKMFTSERESVMFGGGLSVIYPGTHLEVTALGAPAIVFEVNSYCQNFHFGYELFAEDAISVEGEVRIEAAQVIEKLRMAGILEV